jgi:hypothetical protein
MKRILTLCALICLSLTAMAQNTATITFSRPKWADGTDIPVATGLSYNVYQGVGQGTAKTKVGTITTTTGNITSGLLSGGTYCFQVTAFLTGQEATTESARSNEACKSFTAVSTVTITVQ